MKHYGQATNPEIDFQNIKDFNIALFCGTTDRNVSPDDYITLKDKLVETGACKFFKEYDHGHMAFLMPKDNDYFYEILAVIRNFSKDYQDSILKGTSEDLSGNPLSCTEEINEIFEKM